MGRCWLRLIWSVPAGKQPSDFAVFLDEFQLSRSKSVTEKVVFVGFKCLPFVAVFALFAWG